MIQGAAFRVLACFHDSDTRNFAALCEQAGYPTDLGGYYIRQLIDGGYLQKIERGRYQILPKGKQQLAQSYGKQLFGLRPRLSVIVIPRQNDDVIVLRRKVQPFIGAAEWPAGAVVAGEGISTAAARIAQLRLGIEVPLKLHGFFRRIDMYDNTVFDDKLFAVHSCAIPANTQVAAGNTVGENLFVAAAELHAIENPSRSLLDIFRFSEDNDTYIERTYMLTASDLALPSAEI